MELTKDNFKNLHKEYIRLFSYISEKEYLKLVKEKKLLWCGKLITTRLEEYKEIPIQIISIEVKSIDVNQAKKELKKCPKIVRDYVRSLESVYEFNRSSLNKAIAKLRESKK